jgi:hypothetical protein
VIAGISLELLCGLVGALFVVVLGTWLARRKETAAEAAHSARRVSESASER